MTLVDTSVWIDFFRGNDRAHVAKLESLLNHGEDIAVCGVILTEVLQGIRHDHEFTRTQHLFRSLMFLPMTETIFVRAAEIYRDLRKQGITIRKSVDCMIAATALEHDVALLHNDKDFQPIAEFYALRVMTVGN
jgi:predicted nucleic acid-binding protein